MKQFNAKSKFNCTLKLIKSRVPRKSEKRFHIGRHWPTRSTSGTGTCSTREKVPCQQPILNRPMLLANVSPDVAISPARSGMS